MVKNAKPISDQQLDFVDDKSAALLLNTPSSARRMLWVIVLFFIIALVWASQAKLDQVTVGNGKVIASSQLQVVQNLEGGIVETLLVKEGDQVEQGQQLLIIDDTQFQSDFNEQSQSLNGLQADSIRLNALLASININRQRAQSNWRQSIAIQPQTLNFPEALKQAHPELVRRQQNEFSDQISQLESQLAVIEQQISQKTRERTETQSRVNSLRSSYGIASKELAITKPLADEGVVPKIELLKLQRQLNDTRRELKSAELQLPIIKAAIQEAILKRIDTAQLFRSNLQSELNDISDQLASLSASQIGLQDRVNRTIIVSPVTGIVQTLHTNTVGGVIQPGMDVITIVPTEDNLLIEAQIAPKDIAFLRPNLRAMIKFSAYDFTIYGGLEGELETISADTITNDKGDSFYQVRIRTAQNYLLSSSGEKLPIIPGMTASTDIITGKRTVLDYLLKPIISAQQNALRE
ncbi:hemolysin secretion protein D [Photobacterium jeanii]|uniref:Membrane fusion protein (MFP) family protein n=1 Tax=Photobacterium jeanii TaxID=858640 RepID=A0A178K339_9GAMM|nr:HlyD family type I secretion periplasmic adaptor subunit [Photobacterium jeanii]OAN11132.1 hemolysin secretion protein D [Photobacterium jeanii]PST90651.1 HlyD family type I secretion periplasmic adaptor subunit [Photobacterium jeanii]